MAGWTLREKLAAWGPARTTVFVVGIGGLVTAGAMWGASIKIERDVKKVSPHPTFLYSSFDGAVVRQVMLRRDAHMLSTEQRLEI
jgi:hypothetical protein